MEAYRRRMWEILCRDWFQAYVGSEVTVLELGAGHCEFINAIHAAQKIAVDLNPDTARHAAPDVRVIQADIASVPDIADGEVDVVFLSNVLEHLERPAIAATLGECFRCLRSGGRLLILQPNIRYCARDYWMFFDHVTPIDDRALVEALEVSGFAVERNIPRFLPFTTQSRLPRALWLLRLYLRIPMVWRVFGGQAFIVAVRNA